MVRHPPGRGPRHEPRGRPGGGATGWDHAGGDRPEGRRLPGRVALARSRSRPVERLARRALLVTGVPGVGKTTLLRRLAAALNGRRVGGFLTDEVRERGRRVGFRIAPHGGRARLMAHVDFEAPQRVGRYGVDVAAIDAVAEDTLPPDLGVSVYIIDEIGRMECLSPRFVARMRALLASDRPVVASVARRGGGFIQEVKDRADAELWEVTRANRDALVQRILQWLAAH